MSGFESTYQGFESIISDAKVSEKISKGLGGWLMYEHHSYRADLFSEKYLTHGLGNLLAGNTREKVIAEFTHPILKQRKQGRPPQIDFVVLNDSQKISIALESKWVGTKNSSTPSISDILWDLIRLETLNYEYNTRSFFILAGKKSQIDAVFSDEKFHGYINGKAKPLLPTGQGPLTLDLTSASKDRLIQVEKHLKRYKRVQIAAKIDVSGMKKYPDDCKKFENQVCVWSISKSKTSDKRFRYEDLVKRIRKRAKSKLT